MRRRTFGMPCLCGYTVAMANKTPGIYALTIRLARPAQLAYGGETHAFPAGWYVYVGSALGGLEARVGRHLRTSQPKHWHVDALLAKGEVVDVQLLLVPRFGGSTVPRLEPALASQDHGVTASPSNCSSSCECTIASAVGGWRRAEPVPGFGCSDCRCPTHLFHFPEIPTGSLLAPRVRTALDEIFRRLGERYENHALWDRDPFQTLIKCILSLRTQDPVTDAAAERLFAVARTPQQLAATDPAVVEKLIFPVGMFRRKAVGIIEIARQVLDRFGGETPSEIDALLTLPGVGRKTANLVRSFAFHLDAICVDTHVHRITNRWGLVRSRTPDETECELRAVLPPAYWSPINAQLVQHGQQICRPIGPKCGKCFLAGFCRYADLQAEEALRREISGMPPHPSLKF